MGTKCPRKQGSNDHFEGYFWILRLFLTSKGYLLRITLKDSWGTLRVSWNSDLSVTISFRTKKIDTEYDWAEVPAHNANDPRPPLVV